MMRWQRVALAGAIVAPVVVIAAGCSLGWEVRPDPGEGGAPDTSVPDVAIIETGVDAGKDAPAEAGVDAACTAPSAELAAARKGARTCTLGNAADCKASVKDECGCDVVVRAAGSAEATAYAAAVGAWVAECGKALCSGTCPTLTPPNTWACLQPDGTIHCVP
jgi:hypothetical protein